jgi:excisionase family DNA binding protein
MIGLREAARHAGVNKSTILRAIRAGRMSATRVEGGGYVIDPAEVFRVYPPQPEARPEAHQGAEEGERRPAPPPDATELRIRNARLEAQLEAAQCEREAAERERRWLQDALAEARAQRDEWQAQAKQLALAAPRPERRRWWPWRRSA